ncbi:hypothetical protein CAOG_07056 [Capsaspora owczarzaki ATCC 30864]|uniref:Kinesin motor domain-containing protein n=1 Tax=Capsaspora owczarzaki (strain ATCC 30864) TaxID=595528 RepID=A0A0D2VYI6_CAPO3|nr:hypothetical protein CAOG_07056 [Capsaspora owczarzaki ATCC 30864]KJE96787.1 hypothetical protein CAOG_007056 [Capsaspora owczarzaki ATCC 30864]|eukprot:XP_004343780.1 hypothetical protein CAOG_07056 [Capsaspora owczarzaki ATCC 30864]
MTRFQAPLPVKPAATTTATSTAGAGAGAGAAGGLRDANAENALRNSNGAIQKIQTGKSAQPAVPVAAVPAAAAAAAAPAYAMMDTYEDDANDGTVLPGGRDGDRSDSEDDASDDDDDDEDDQDEKSRAKDPAAAFYRAQRKLFQTPMVGGPSALSVLGSRDLNDTIMATSQVDPRVAALTHQEDMEDDSASDDDDNEDEEPGTVTATRFAKPAAAVASDAHLSKQPEPIMTMEMDVSGINDDSSLDQSDESAVADDSLDSTMIQGNNNNNNNADDEAGSLREPIHVYLRVRPLTAVELSSGGSCVEIVNKSSVILHPPANAHTLTKEQQYKFTAVMGPETDQRATFDKTTLPLLQDVEQGHNCVLLCYGVTNAGKTYTMQGAPNAEGVLPRSVEYVFNGVAGRQLRNSRLKPKCFNDVQLLSPEAEAQENEFRHHVLSGRFMDEKSASHIVADAESKARATGQEKRAFKTDYRYRYSVWVSYVEVYNENLYDLLQAPVQGKARPSLKLGSDAQQNVYMKNVREIRVFSVEEAYRVLRSGQRARQVASTLLNSASSRSHCIFSIKIVRSLSEDDLTNAFASSMAFFDLAGSERSGKTKNTGDRFNEACSINSSLMNLGMVLRALQINQQRMLAASKINPPPRVTLMRVPYRESKLTHILHNFLAENSVSCHVGMIVNINPSVSDCDETSHVLGFSATAQEVTTFKNILPKIDTGLTSLVDDKAVKRLVEASASDAAEVERLRGFIQDLLREKREADERFIAMEAQLRAEVAQEMMEQQAEWEESLKAILTEENDRMNDRLDDTVAIYTRIIEERRSQLVRRQTRLSIVDIDGSRPSLGRLSLVPNAVGRKSLASSSSQAESQQPAAQVLPAASSAELLDIVDDEGRRMSLATLRCTLESQQVKIQELQESVQGHADTNHRLSAKLRSAEETMDALREKADESEELLSLKAKLSAELTARVAEVEALTAELAAARAEALQAQAQAGSKTTAAETRAAAAEAKAKSMVSDLEQAIQELQTMAQEQQAMDAELQKFKSTAASAVVHITLNGVSQQVTDAVARAIEAQLASLAEEVTLLRAQLQEHNAASSSAPAAAAATTTTTTASPFKAVRPSDFSSARAAVDELEHLADASLRELEREQIAKNTVPLTAAEAAAANAMAAAAASKRRGKAAAASAAAVADTSSVAAAPKRTSAKRRSGETGGADEQAPSAGVTPVEGGRKKRRSSVAPASSAASTSGGDTPVVADAIIEAAEKSPPRRISDMGNLDDEPGSASRSSQRNNSYYCAMDKTSKSAAASALNVRSPLSPLQQSASATASPAETPGLVGRKPTQRSLKLPEAAVPSSPGNPGSASGRVYAALRNSPIMKKVFATRNYQAAMEVAEEAAQTAAGAAAAAAKTDVAAKPTKAGTRKLMARPATTSKLLNGTSGMADSPSNMRLHATVAAAPIERLLSPIAGRTRTRASKK